MLVKQISGDINKGFLSHWQWGNFC